MLLPPRPEKCTLSFPCRALQQGQGKRERPRGEREEVQRQGEGEEEAQSGKRDQEGERRSQAADERLVETHTHEQPGVSYGGLNVLFVCGDVFELLFQSNKQSK